jgi:hypothetical protein
VTEKERPLRDGVLDAVLTPGPGRGRRLGGAREDVMDFIYVAGVLGFLALSWGLVRLCEKVG